jgi:tRNA-dihydrouridine synthase
VKTANKMNGLDRKFCIAPMMDWTESLGGSMAWRRACARLAHVRSPFLLLSFLSAARACT